MDKKKEQFTKGKLGSSKYSKFGHKIKSLTVRSYALDTAL